MHWKQIAIVILWVTGVLLGVFPQLCDGLSICEKSPFPLVVLIGVIVIIINLSDVKRMKKKIYEEMNKGLKDAETKIKK
jgi:uncharacterized membrane protein